MALIATCCHRILYICNMEQNETLAKYKYFLDFMFPENLLDYFEAVCMEEKPISGESQIGLDELYQSELHIYLDALVSTKND